MRYVEQFLYDNLRALGIFLKSGHTLSKAIVWKYLKGKGFFKFQAQQKPY